MTKTHSDLRQKAVDVDPVRVVLMIAMHDEKKTKKKKKRRRRRRRKKKRIRN
jgi:hypothetical protein